MLSITYTNLGGAREDVRAVITRAPAILATASKYTNEAAKIAPKAVPVIDYIIPLLKYGPTVAPLAKPISYDLYKALRDAPKYKSTLRSVSRVMANAPKTARQISSVLSQVSTVAKKIGEDPALDAFVDRATKIVELAKKQKSKKKPSKPGASIVRASKGIGMDAAIPWMDRAIFTMENKWILIAIPTAAIVLVGAVGYRVGKRSGKRSAT